MLTIVDIFFFLQLQSAGKSSRISSFKDQRIATSLPIIDLVDAIKPGSINYDVVSAGKTDEVGKMISINALKLPKNKWASPSWFKCPFLKRGKPKTKRIGIPSNFQVANLQPNNFPYTVWRLPRAVRVLDCTTVLAVIHLHFCRNLYNFRKNSTMRNTPWAWRERLEPASTLCPKTWLRSTQKWCLQCMPV